MAKKNGRNDCHSRRWIVGPVGNGAFRKSLQGSGFSMQTTAGWLGIFLY